MNETTNSLPNAEEGTPKTYCSPQLIEYGNLQQLTQSVGKMGAADGGSGSSMDKTMA